MRGTCTSACTAFTWACMYLHCLPLCAVPLCLQALAYLNSKCGEPFMRGLVSNSVFAHVSTAC